MELRKEKRLAGGTTIRINDGERSFLAEVTDFSKRGLSAKTEYILPTFKEIDIEIDIDEKSVKLKGCVRWVNESVEKSDPQLNEIGILINKPPTEYLQYITGL